MPIARHDGKLIYFAHVPKCAGTAVEAYLAERFGPLAFVDQHHHKRRVEHGWTATSPQHIDLASLRLLFPETFFDHSFAVVRHPVARVVSAYHFQRDTEGSIPKSIGLSEWLSELADELRERPFAHDNHWRPMVEIVPSDARIFYLEHGLDDLVPWFDEICGAVFGPREFPEVNKARSGKAGSGGQKPETPTPTDLSIIAEIYSDDFKRFGYSLDTSAPSPENCDPKAGIRTYRSGQVLRAKGKFDRIQSKLSRLLRT